MFTVCVLHGPVSEHAHARVTTDHTADADAFVAASGCPSKELLGDTTYPSVESAVDALILERVDLITACDACCQKVKAQYKVFPSARASQAIAKCRKSHGNVRKGKKGSSLKRWQREKWKDKVTGKPCGHEGGPEYCRPTHKVSKKTPEMPKGDALAQRIRQKQSGQRAKRV